MLKYLIFLVLACASSVSSDRERVEHGAASRFARHEDSIDKHADLEALLGSKKDADHFDDLPPEEAKKRLRAIANAADKNKDGFIDHDELRAWVDHSIRAVDDEETDDRMREMDADGDGFISWEEYMEETFAEQNISKLDAEDTRSMHEDRKYFQGFIGNPKGNLISAADLDKDGKLSRSELSAFITPENFPYMHNTIIENTMAEKDNNKDGAIDISEYLGEMAENPQSEWHAVEKNRFMAEFDKNGDGLLKEDEIRNWLIPDTAAITSNEAAHLIENADKNKDGKLSIQEIVDAYKIFTGSEVTNYGEALTRVEHNEL